MQSFPAKKGALNFAYTYIWNKNGGKDASKLITPYVQNMDRRNENDFGTPSIKLIKNIQLISTKFN